MAYKNAHFDQFWAVCLQTYTQLHHAWRLFGLVETSRYFRSGFLVAVTRFSHTCWTLFFLLVSVLDLTQSILFTFMTSLLYYEDVHIVIAKNASL